ncbi:hypothetical protein CBM2608_A50051 [Cupriavidus taiwanensis]|nr:hypothetical protein CBM2608_A50051 [Cupriavidus taiwanensis]
MPTNEPKVVQAAKFCLQLQTDFWVHRLPLRSHGACQ